MGVLGPAIVEATTAICLGMLVIEVDFTFTHVDASKETRGK